MQLLQSDSSDGEQEPLPGPSAATPLLSDDVNEDENGRQSRGVNVHHKVRYSLSLASPVRMLSCLVTSVKALVLTLLSLLRRVLCFWRRNKTSGGFSEIDRRQFQHSGPSSTSLASWDSWGEPSEIVIGSGKPETVQDHIQAYRDSLQEARRQAAQRKESESKGGGEGGAADADDPGEVEPDLFADLVPQVRRQKKLYVGPRDEPQGSRRDSSGRLGVQSENAMDPLLAMGGELTEWGSGGAGGGWEETADGGDDEDLNEAIRKQKRASRGRAGSSSYASSYSSR